MAHFLRWINVAGAQVHFKFLILSKNVKSSKYQSVIHVISIGFTTHHWRNWWVSIIQLQRYLKASKYLGLLKISFSYCSCSTVDLGVSTLQYCNRNTFSKNIFSQGSSAHHFRNQRGPQTCGERSKDLFRITERDLNLKTFASPFTHSVPGVKYVSHV